VLRLDQHTPETVVFHRAEELMENEIG
jgi:hypothetical protein